MEEIEKYPYRTEYDRIVTGIERITPELAEKMLATSKGNRALKKKRVEQFPQLDIKSSVQAKTIF